jgi:hypothetical protein
MVERLYPIPAGDPSIPKVLGNRIGASLRAAVDQRIQPFVPEGVF